MCKPGITEPPVPIDHLAEEVEGLDVQEAIDLTTVPGAPDVPPTTELSGLLLPAEKRIWVNGAEAERSDGRRRFTIAHELGHWRLHARKGRARTAIHCRPAEIDDARPGLEIDRKIEAEANRFAAALLMPPGILRREAPQARLSIPLLAKRFGVSTAAMKLQLNALELLPPYMR